MKTVRFIAILLLLLSATLTSVSSAGPITDFCKTHPTSKWCI